ncbi:MAG TPA: glycosyltransferase [Sphingobacteriaceae bacterium]
MRKKVYFVLSSLNAGGAERVFWLLSQNFDKTLYDVNLVLLNSRAGFFSSELKDVRVIDLKTGKASRSFFKLYRLFKKEKPYAVYTTGGHISALVGLISFFIPIPHLIARPSNVAEVIRFKGPKSRFLSFFNRLFYNRFDTVVCQSEEIRSSVRTKYRESTRIVIIPNPVIPTDLIKKDAPAPEMRKLINVARLTRQKGHERLIRMMAELPAGYRLDIAGDGPLKEEITGQVRTLNLGDRVKILGLVNGIPELLAGYDLMVLPSYVEGFPNVVIESLSVGIPVVAFEVGGISALIRDGFNGYIVEQGDLAAFKDRVIRACSRSWDHQAIKDDVATRFSIESIVSDYQELIA